MPTIAELLNGLNVRELRQLAKNNKIKLIKEGFWSDSPATRREDIMDVLLDSGKVTKKRIEAARRSPKTKKKGRTPKSKSPMRKPLRAAEKTQILKRQKHKCAMCKMDISKLAVIHYDHKRALALGGSDTVRNRQALCANCHAEKTQEDRLKISKARKR